LQRDSERTLTVTIRLEIYEDIYINQFMCSEYCPCADVTAKSEWIDIPDMFAFAREEPWDFTGTLTTYKECINNIDS